MANRAFWVGTQDREQLVKDSADSSSVLYLGADLLTREKNRQLRITKKRIVDQELCGQETFVGAVGIKRKFSNFNASCKEMSRYFTSEALAEEWVRDHFRSTFWTKRSSVEEWDS